MTTVAQHMRMTSTQVSDEDVNRRKSAIADLTSTYSKMKDVSAILSLASEIAVALSGDGTPGERLSQQVEAAVQPHAAAFVRSERPLEVGMCAAMAVHALIEAPPAAMKSWTVADIMAAGLWSALSFQHPLIEPKREALRVQLLTAAQARVAKVAQDARTRAPVPDFKDLTTLVEGVEGATSLKKATNETIDALRNNSALDREELDFLWWAMLDHSRTLKKRLAELSEPTRVIAAGIEAAGKLRRLPCDVHFELILRSVSDDLEMNMGALIAAVGADGPLLTSPFVNDILSNAPAVFPLLYAFNGGNIADDDAAVKRTTSEWGSRALLEAAIFHMRSGTAGKL